MHRSRRHRACRKSAKNSLDHYTTTPCLALNICTIRNPRYQAALAFLHLTKPDDRTLRALWWQHLHAGRLERLCAVGVTKRSVKYVSAVLTINESHSRLRSILQGLGDSSPNPYRLHVLGSTGQPRFT